MPNIVKMTARSTIDIGAVLGRLPVQENVPEDEVNEQPEAGDE